MSGAGDLLVLTAAHRAQAAAYRARLAERERSGDLPSGFAWLVVPDAGERRIGSGGATILALVAAARLASGRPGDLASAFRDRRVVIVHSGGDSRRLPAFAARGKAFAPVPTRRRSGGPGTLFDLVLDDLLAFPSPAGGQVLVASGDALVGAGHEGIDLASPDGGLVGLAQRGTPERGARHGVFVRGRGDLVRDFLQKPDRARAAAAGAILADGSLLVDTGIASFAPEAVAALLEGSGVRIGRGVVALGAGLARDLAEGRVEGIDLYCQIFGAFAGGPRRRFSLDGLPSASPRLARHLRTLHAAVRGVSFRVRTSEGERFLHLGSTREYLATLTRDAAAARAFGLGGAGIACRRRGEAFPLACADLAAVRDGAGSVVEGCLAPGAMRLARDQLLSGFGPDTRGAIDLSAAPGWGAAALPIGRARFATILFHADDDGKTPLARGGTFGGRPWSAWLAAHGVGLAEVSDRGEEVTAWDARLWPLGDRPDLASLAWMRSADAPAPAAWRRGRRHSLAELVAKVSHPRSLALEAEIARRGRIADPAASLAADDALAAETLVGAIRSGSEAKRVFVALAAGNGDDPFARARRELVRSRLAVRWPRVAPRGTADGLAARALAGIGEAICLRVAPAAPPGRGGPLPPARPDQAVWTSAPVRVDLAGGWSDTPPICIERGGTVVNAAILLNGQQPIQVVAKRTDEPTITVDSVDLGRSRRFVRTSELLAFRDPHDWAALAKAALFLSGLVPPDPRIGLRRWLERSGGGLALSLFSAVPKGSGLGTSSILGAATLACLDRVAGRSSDLPGLVARTGALEQLMSTRGGWQDQVGGLYPGVKIARTVPGLEQRVAVEPIVLPPAAVAELEARTILYFTGHRRLARDILEQVVFRYLARETLDGQHVLRIVAELKEGAERMAAALQMGDIDSYGKELSAYWKLKCRLDPKSTIAAVEGIVAPLRRYLSAWELPGAGGGGFLLMLARSPAAADRIRRHLDRHPPNALARPFTFRIDGGGLRLTVL